MGDWLPVVGETHGPYAPKPLQLWGSFLEPTALFREPGALGGPADRDGREDDYEGDYDGVDELGDQGSSCLTQEHGKELLDGLVPGQSCHQP